MAQPIDADVLLKGARLLEASRSTHLTEAADRQAGPLQGIDPG
jgi:hypothetical protein